MDDIQPTGKELKTLLRFAKKKPVNFAFNPSSDKKSHFFAAHKRQIPTKLGKQAKEAGESKKVAFGTFTVDGRLLVLKCDKLVPKLAKDVKNFLKTNKIPMNVEVLDEAGKSVESDIEDLPKDEDDDFNEAPTIAPEPEKETAAPKAHDLDALKARMTGLQPQIMAVEGPVGDQLRGAFKVAVGFLKTQDLDKATSALGQIEAALAKVGSGKTPSDDAPGEDTPEGSTPPDDAKALMARLTAISAQLKTMDPDKTAKLAEALKKVIAATKAGKLEIAATGAAQIEAALAKLAPTGETSDAPVDSEAAKKATQIAGVMRTRGEALPESAGRTKLLEGIAQALELVENADTDGAMTELRVLQAELKALEAAPAPTDDNDDNDETSTAEADWFKAFMRLEADVTAALSQGLVADVDGLRKVWNWATAEAGDASYADALAQLPEIERLLADKLDPDTSAFEREIGPDVKPFADARLEWRKALTTMGQEMDKLKGAIVKECQGDIELQIVADNIEDLTMHVAELDTRLADALDAVVNAADPATRDQAKGRAAQVVKQFEAELDAPFFKVVDQNNGFTSVSVAKTATDALANIGDVLTGDAA